MQQLSAGAKSYQGEILPRLGPGPGAGFGFLGRIWLAWAQILPDRTDFFRQLLAVSPYVKFVNQGAAILVVGPDLYKSYRPRLTN